MLKEVYKRLLNGELRPYPTIVDSVENYEIIPDNKARVVTIVIVSGYYATKLAFKSKIVYLFPMLVLGLEAGKWVNSSLGWGTGKEVEFFYYLVPLFVIIVSVVYGYFGYKKSPEYKGIRHKWESFVKEKIQDDSPTNSH